MAQVFSSVAHVTAVGNAKKDIASAIIRQRSHSLDPQMAVPKAEAELALASIGFAVDQAVNAVRVSFEKCGDDAGVDVPLRISSTRS